MNHRGWTDAPSQPPCLAPSAPRCSAAARLTRAPRAAVHRGAHDADRHVQCAHWGHHAVLGVRHGCARCRGLYRFWRSYRCAAWPACACLSASGGAPLCVRPGCRAGFEESHRVFREAMPNGFAWEVTEVYSGCAPCAAPGAVEPSQSCCAQRTAVYHGLARVAQRPACAVRNMLRSVS